MASQQYPSFADYQSALQHPEKAFTINFLKQGLVESDLWGFPRVRSGGFTLTYKVSYKEKTWAARCFHRVVRDRASRYAQICQVLDNLNLPFFIPTQYFHHGVTVKGKQFPISILEWLEGESLESYIIHHLDDGNSLRNIGEKFRQACRLMESKNIAHGDLSHRNIIIKNDELFLIDYDGMYVPSLSGRKSSELGNIHFQHPLRTNVFFNSQVDRFSSIVIFLAIQAIASEPSIWKRYQSGGEGLIFHRTDFLNPEESRLLQDLEKITTVGKYIPHFREICLSPIESVPSLEGFLSDGAASQSRQPRLWETQPIKKHELPVLSSENKDAIFQKEGDLVSIVGKVYEVFHGFTVRGEEHIFVNFGDWQENCFTGILWGPLLTDIQRMDISVDSWAGQWMSFTGLVSVRNQRPQIQVEGITDFFLFDNELKAKEFLGLKYSGDLNKRSNDYQAVKLNSKGEKALTKFPEGNAKNPRRITLDDVFIIKAEPEKEALLNQLFTPKKSRKKKK